MKNGKPSPAKMRAIIDEAWTALYLACDEAGYVRSLDDAFDAQLKAERDHRRYGDRFTDGRAGYRLSASYTAKLLTLQKAYEKPPRIRNWEHAATVTRWAALGWALGHSLRRDGLHKKAFPDKAFDSIDYAQDVGGKWQE